MVTVHLRDEDGLRPASGAETHGMAERVRSAARDTDTVVRLGPGRLGVLAEDAVAGGEVAMAKRLLAVVDRTQDDGPRPVATVVVLEIADPYADGDAVITHLARTAGPIASRGGLVVLPPWVTGQADRSRDPDGPADTNVNREHTRRALNSGRFGLGQIGRASCREIVVISVVAVLLKKNRVSLTEQHMI